MKSILIIVPYDTIYPPMNGGMQRCFHIMHQLAKHFKLTAIIHQDKKSFSKCTEEFPAMATAEIYSTSDINVNDLFTILPTKLKEAIRSRVYMRDWRKSADGSLLKYYPILTQLLKQKKFEAIVLENLATLNAVKIIRRFDKKVKVIYDAHNVDSNLAEMAVAKFGMTNKYLVGIKRAESNLFKVVDAIFSCSQQDKDDFIKLNSKLCTSVIPNGVIVAEKFNEGVKKDFSQYILFCGSLSSSPNSEGLFWFYKNCWNQVKEKFPGLKLLVVGSGKAPEHLDSMFQDESVDMIGTVEDVRDWYNKAAISIVPLLTGSGTRLKILEAMSLGVPVISTALGAEGIEYTEGKNIVIQDSAADFSRGVIHLLQNKNKRVEINENARKLVEQKYDWNVIGEKLKNFFYMPFFVNK